MLATTSSGDSLLVALQHACKWASIEDTNLNIWIETPAAKFFRNSPVLELLDFLERLAPFTAPALILRDPAPRMAPGHKVQPTGDYN